MKALDTNVLARFFIDDASDAQATQQRPAAIAAMTARAFVSVTVLLELEWVMRGFYELPPPAFSQVMRALAGIEHITMEDRDAVLAALDAFERAWILPMRCICAAAQGPPALPPLTSGWPSAPRPWR